MFQTKEDERKEQEKQKEKELDKKYGGLIEALERNKDIDSLLKKFDDKAEREEAMWYVHWKATGGKKGTLVPKGRKSGEEEFEDVMS